MSKEITSKIIGQLKQDDNFSDWWKSDETEIPLFDNKLLKITFIGCEPEHDQTFVREADQALTSFFTLTINDRISISELAYKNCMNFIDDVGSDEFDESLLKIKDSNEIWKFIHPTEIYVARRPYKDKDIYIQIVCECDWEDEHGLQFVFRQGRQLTRISAQDGWLTEADAYGKPDEEDELLSNFK